MPAEHVVGVTALAVTVMGVGIELPFAGAVTVMMPLEVELKAHEANRRVKAKYFIAAPQTQRTGNLWPDYGAVVKLRTAW